MKNLFVLTVIAITTLTFATPNSWLTTSYRKSGYSTSSMYRSPVTDGHMDLRLFVDNATFTDAVFTINYDSDVVDTIGSYSLLDLANGLSLVSITNENLDGTWKKATLTLTGAVTIGEVDGSSEFIFRLRLIPVDEGTVPITLWPAIPYPQSYHTCQLALTNSGTEVVHERKQWNDGTQLFTFTDKTSATTMYHFDLNFGDPIAGFLRVVYSDQSEQLFYQSDHDKGITINPEMGEYFVTPQPDAVSHTLVFHGYGDWQLNLNGGWNTSHSQPDGYLYIKEKYEGFSGFEASEDDLFLTIETPGIGEDFAGSTYLTRIASGRSGVIDKEFTYQYIDNDKIGLTILGGLAADNNINLYIYKDGLVLGRDWFAVSEYYPTTFTVEDQNSNPISGALVRFSLRGMMGLTFIDDTTDENGQAVFRLPGDPEYGHYIEYNVIAGGYDAVSDAVEVRDSPVSVPITMVASQAVSLPEFASFAAFWGQDDCAWNNDCDGADINLDGLVNTDDLMLFAVNWLRES